MALYFAKVLADDGSYVLTLAADSLDEARAEAALQGRVVYCKKRAGWLPMPRLNSEEREQLLTQLAFLTSSGTGTGAALRTMQGHYSGRMEQVCGELLGHIEGGMALDQAMEKVGTQDFPAATLALVRAGYRAGQGVEALEGAASFEQQLRALKASSGAGLISASLGFFAAVTTTLLSVFYVGPQILESSLIAAAGDAVSVGWANTVGLWLGWGMVALVLVMLFFVVNHFGVRRFNPVFADHMTLRVPLWRDIALARERYLAFFSVQAMVAPNVSLEQAFEITAKGTPPGALKKELTDAARDVREGRSWVGSLRTLDAIDRAALNGVTDRDQLSLVFKKLAQQYRLRYGRSREKASLVLHTTAALCLTASGGVLFGLSALPMLQATTNIL